MQLKLTLFTVDLSYFLTDRLALILGLSIGIGLFIIFVVVIAVFVIYHQKNSTKYHLHSKPINE